MKQWKKTQKGIYDFFVNDKQMGTMQIRQATLERKATVQLEGQTFTIKRTGFWKSSISITNQADVSVAEIYPSKWYANSFTMDYNEKKYQLSARNNPLAEWGIFEGEKEVIAYGLDVIDGKTSVKITASATTDHLFDTILWYLFLPIAMENGSDNLVFSMLLTTQ